MRVVGSSSFRELVRSLWRFLYESCSTKELPQECRFQLLLGLLKVQTNGFVERLLFFLSFLSKSLRCWSGPIPYPKIRHRLKQRLQSVCSHKCCSIQLLCWFLNLCTRSQVGMDQRVIENIIWNFSCKHQLEWKWLLARKLHNMKELCDFWVAFLRTEW